MALDAKEAELYGRYFSVVFADTPRLQEQIYRLRYQVYCVEHPFENPADHFVGQEMDQYDCHSVHAALLHKASGAVCGCVRLILPHPGRSLPIMGLVSEHDRNELPTARTAEVSRYAVSKAFRRRTGESEYPDVHFGDLGPSELRRMMPHISLGLMLAVAALSESYGITHLAAVMAPALLRLLRACGMDFLPTGPVVEHHGKRQPCFASVIDLLHGVRTANPAYFAVIQSGLGALRASSASAAAMGTYSNSPMPPMPSTGSGSRHMLHA